MPGVADTENARVEPAVVVEVEGVIVTVGAMRCTFTESVELARCPVASVAVATTL